MANSGGRATISSAGNTGAPCEDGLICRSCHLGGAFGPTTEEFKLLDPSSGIEVMSYAPGRRYNAEITVSTNIPGGASAYGFQATALDNEFKNAGYWTNPSNAVQIGTADIQCNDEASETRTYIEHTGAVPIRTFRVDWQAPSCDIGDISFYYIGNAVNRNSSTSGDVGGTGSSRIYPSDLESMISIDQPIITSGIYIADEQIKISSNISDNSEVILAASDAIILLPDMQLSVGSTLCIINDNCLE